MAVKSENTRVSLTISKELDSKLDKLSNIQGISKNACINNLLNSTIDAQIKMWEMLQTPNMLEHLMKMSETLGNLTDEQKENMKAVMNTLTSDREEDKATVSKTDELMKSLKG